MELISEQYKKLLVQKHTTVPNWGNCSGVTSQWIPFINKLINNVSEVLDYGCGKGKLSLKIPTIKYDPGVEEFNELPSGIFEFLVCLDVLEHIEPDRLDNVLKDLQERSKHCFLSICTVKAGHLLPNGTNAHLIVETKEWWLDKLSNYFEIIEIFPSKTPATFAVYCRSN